MKSIFNKIKAMLPFKKQKNKAETEYTDLAPIDKIENGAEYLNALEWALGNKRVKNIALMPSSGITPENTGRQCRPGIRASDITFSPMT